MARKFDGVDDIVQIQDASSLDLVIGSISGWFNRNATGAWHCIISKGVDGTNASHNYGIEITNTNTMFALIGNSSNYSSVTTTTTFTAKRWYHVCFVWDGATLRIYIDGSLNITAGQTLTAAGNAANVVIGEFGGSSDPFNGFLDDIRVYNRVLSSSEVVAIYKGQHIKNGLVGWWPLFGNSNPEPDMSGNRNAGTVLGPLKALPHPGFSFPNLPTR